MNKLKRCIPVLCLGLALGVPALAVSQPAVAAVAQPDKTSIALMNRFFNSVKTLEADFQQEVENDKGRITKRASGEIALSRPGRFRWVYADPEPQEIIGDGEKLWVYDKDLAQVSVRPLNSALGNTPAALIAGRNVVAQHYQVRSLGRRGDLYWVELIPKSENYGFRRVLMGLADDAGLLHSLELYDNFGQTTRLRFSNMQVNKPVSGQQFSFAPPAGVDVLQQ